MNRFFEQKQIIGMVHLLPLPGSPKYRYNDNEIALQAFKDVEELIKGGVDAFIIENFNDDPYGETIDVFGFALMTSICSQIRIKYPHVKMGINIQFDDYEKELALAKAVRADFIRSEVFIDTRVGIQGILKPKAREIALIKNQYNLDVLIFADVDVKHSVALVKEPLIELVARCKEEGADAVILTGTKTGENAKIEDIMEVKKQLGESFPIIVGSGIKPATVKQYLQYADGVIVGSSIKIDGNVRNGVDSERVRLLVENAK